MQLRPPYRRQDLNDPYLTTRLTYRGKLECEVCHEDALCALITEVTLPEQISVHHTIIRSGQPAHKEHIISLGINCGCYAKFHRQVAHIITSMNFRHKGEPGYPIPTP